MPVAETFVEARPQYRDGFAEAYRHASAESTYQRHHGLLVIPVMGPEGTAPVVARVHAPYGERIYQFQLAKDRIPPVFAAPADTNSGDTILSATLSFPTPRPNTNGDLTYGVSGEYLFVQPLGGRGTEDTFPIDKHPFVSAIDILDLLPPPDGDLRKTFDWRWNVSNIDTRLLGSYAIIG